MSLNVHHLELFFYVAKYEGITEAVRKMPYGIQQPAVSGQILQLERSLGVKLFHRRPFALTPAGEDLYDYVYPFFSRLDQVAARLRGEESQHLRLAASASIMANHLPAVLERMRREFPELRLSLREVKSTEIEAALQKQEADVAISQLQKTPAPGVKAIKLLELPLVLYAPEEVAIEKFGDLSRSTIGGEISLPLISLPGNETIPRLFQAGLAKRGLRWETAMEVSDLSLIPRYVDEGFGWGVSVAIPGVEPPEGVRAISLPANDFHPLSLGLMHTGDLKPLAERFVEIASTYAAALGDGDKAQTKKKPAAKRKRAS
ncbi:MAG: LysR family transcriptional regulator [Verrucomicrobiae bacterium]|nr:LysR family transcriptional regulator [Verrucomicrobiae bacterium]